MLTAQQQAAADKVLGVLLGAPEARQIVLAGYAGTGKTWTTGYIVRRLLEAHRRVCVLAPTHKALGQVRQRLPDSVSTYTIHQALGLRLRRGEDGEMITVAGEGDPPVRDYHCVIVDEASMVGVSLYDRLQVATAGRPVLWIGDPAQLAPVNDGAESPVWSRVSEQVRLTQIVRQAEGSGIAAASLMVRQAIEDGRRVQLRDLQAFEGSEIMIVPGGLASVAGLVADARTDGLDARGICYTNKAALQVIAMVHAATHPPGVGRFCPGDPVVFGRVYGPDGGATPAAMNNEEGLVIGVEGEGDVEGVPVWRVRVRSTDRVVVAACPVDAEEHAVRLARVKRCLARANRDWHRARNDQTHATRKEWLRLLGVYQDRIADLRHTYASTVHKAQGSTYDAAVLHWSDLSSMRDDVEFGRAVYVALTRPSKFLCIVA